MAKRFIDTTIWTQNKWFRKLKPEHKLFWFYLLTTCDSVGVWEEDLELASFIIGFDFSNTKLLEDLGNQILVLNDKKWWIKDFCTFQYGELIENNHTNKPHQAYISMLKKHSLWIDYTNSINRVKEKEKDKEKDKEKEKDNSLIKVENFNEDLLTKILDYGQAKEISKEVCEDYFHHYEKKNWIDGNGIKITNWKSGLINWNKEQTRRELNAKSKQSDSRGKGAIDFNKYEQLRKLNPGA